MAIIVTSGSGSYFPIAKGVKKIGVRPVRIRPKVKYITTPIRVRIVTSRQVQAEADAAAFQTRVRSLFEAFKNYLMRRIADKKFKKGLKKVEPEWCGAWGRFIHWGAGANIVCYSKGIQSGLQGIRTLMDLVEGGPKRISQVYPFEAEYIGYKRQYNELVDEWNELSKVLTEDIKKAQTQSFWNQLRGLITLGVVGGLAVVILPHVVPLFGGLFRAIRRR